ncbi:hypothetical protein [Cognatitamlana onchidii]|uniref:hypothetical protein n=1 Tax=Cognatitamlana onchidii TaxID=2562860 RepID=UPI0010A68618|nr:hypothetical protein [Algibacter onchidii]
MKKLCIVVIIIACMSCTHDKAVQLPEISHADITEINDVSAAYLFYDETQSDSVELNRKNLISTTNWLVNVDKRLTLKQAIPYIQFLQEKKQNSSHKNEAAKNYFTCHNTSINNLGFIEFTQVVYEENIKDDILKFKDSFKIKSINFSLKGDIFILNPEAEPFVSKSSISELKNDILALDVSGNMLSLVFNNTLSFQDYITYKSALLNIELKHAEISNIEFLDN